MLDHITLQVSDYAVAKAFYEKALKPLGYALIMEFQAEGSGDGHAGGFGVAGKPDYWIAEGGKVTPRVHVAFRAETRQAVQDFHDAAIAAGAIDNGAPGLRPHYHPNYYGAFVLDPDGHNIEAVCHAPA